MGRSVTASLVLGFYVDEGKRWDQHVDVEIIPSLPWRYDNDDDLNRWWLELQGFENPVESPFGEDGNFPPGKGWEDYRPYYQAERDFLVGNPPPWEDESFGSAYSESTLFFRVRGSATQTAYWGAELVDTNMFNQPPEVWVNARHLATVMAEQGIPMTKMGWYLLAFEG